MRRFDIGTPPVHAGRRGVASPRGISLAGLTHYWPLTDGPVNNNTGHFADMLSPTGYAVTNTNFPKTNLRWDGKYGAVPRFTLAALGALVNGSAGENWTNFTISAWIKPVNFAALGHIFAKGNSTQRSRNMFVNSSTGTVVISFTSATSTFKSVTSTGALVLNRWQHVCGTFDGANEKIYLNGVLDTSTAFAFTPQTTAEVVGIGVLNAAGVGGPEALMMHITDWKRALTAAEVKALAKDPLILYGTGAAGRVRQRINPPTPAAAGARSPVSPVILGGTGNDGRVVTVGATVGEYLVGLTDYVVLASAIAGNTMLRLPTASSCKSQEFILKQTTAGTTQVAVVGGGTIDGATSRPITGTNTTLHVVSDGSNYLVI